MISMFEAAKLKREQLDRELGDNANARHTLEKLWSFMCDYADEVRADEREACAVVVEETDVVTLGSPGAYERPDDGIGTLRRAANAIRERGTK